MWKKLKNRINKFLWEHSGKKKPMLPAGSIDTTLLRDQTLVFLDRLKAYLKEDPDSFRKMQLSSYYNSSCIPDFNEAISSTLYVLRLCNLFSCAQECIRYVGSGGKRNNAKYRVRYKTMRRMGYRPLVHAFYHGKDSYTWKSANM